MRCGGGTVAAVSRRLRGAAPLRLITLAMAALAVSVLVGCGGEEGIRISAVTATPSTATPTPGTTDGTISGDAEPERVALPDAPENPFAGGRLVESYLAGGGALMTDCVPELVSKWRLAPSVDGPRCAFADLDGDREDEWVFLISFGEGEGDESPYAADLWFFQDEEQDYRFYNSARALANASTTGLRVRVIEDLTNDGLPDVLMTWQECGASTCVTRITIASYHNGDLQNLAPAGAFVETMEDFEVEGTTIRMIGTGAASAGAGPQRETTKVVRWAGSSFRVEEEQGEPTYLVHLVNDADRLFAAGDFAAARDAYLDAASNNTLPDWRAEAHGTPGRPELHAYSTFRAAVASYRLGDPNRGLELLAQTVERYAGTMHAGAAEAYAVAVTGGSSAGEACSAAEQLLDQARAQYVAFWDYGHANPERNVFTLCR